MTSAPPDAPRGSPNPLGDAAATEDYVPLAVRATGAGICAAVAWAALVLWLALIVVGPGGGPGSLKAFNPDAAYVNVMLFGLLPTPFIAAVVAWFLMLKVNAGWRRGGMVLLAVMAGCLLAMILTVVVRELIGRDALLALGLLTLGFTLLLARGARSAEHRLDRQAQE